jgi:hypothetical protein
VKELNQEVEDNAEMAEDGDAEDQSQMKRQKTSFLPSFNFFGGSAICSTTKEK